MTLHASLAKLDSHVILPVTRVLNLSPAIRPRVHARTRYDLSGPQVADLKEKKAENKFPSLYLAASIALLGSVRPNL